MRLTNTLTATVALLLITFSLTTASQQPLNSLATAPIDIDETCLPQWKFCGPGDHPCCCDKPTECCASREGCQIHNFPIPGGDPDFAFLKHYGNSNSPDVPSCGKDRMAEQCLRLILIELETVEVPLELQQSKFKPVPDDERCCGQECTDAQCFQDVRFTFVDLQNPIRLTSNSTGKTSRAGEERLDGDFRIEI